MHSVTELIEEFDRSQAYTLSLWSDLNESQVHWRADENASGIGWHLGHQAAVAHFLVRNLTAAEPSLDTELDKLMDSATPEAERGKLSDLQRLASESVSGSATSTPATLERRPSFERSPPGYSRP
jgi:hypothetical protein